MPYIERTIKSGNLLEVGQYFATNVDGEHFPRSAKESPSDEEREKINDRRAEKQLIRKINANYDGKRGDQFVTYTFRDDVDSVTADRKWDNMLRRIKRYRKKRGLPDFKYICLPEHQGRLHFHVIQNGGIPIEDLTKMWGHGRVTVSILDPTNNFKDLAKYLANHLKPSKDNPDGENIKAPRRKFARRWRCSQNLVNPEPSEAKIIKRGDVLKPPQAPKGYRLLPDWVMGCDKQGNVFKYFECLKLDPPPKAVKKGGKPSVLQDMPELRRK